MKIRNSADILRRLNKKLSIVEERCNPEKNSPEVEEKIHHFLCELSGLIEELELTLTFDGYPVELVDCRTFESLRLKSDLVNDEYEGQYCRACTVSTFPHDPVVIVWVSQINDVVSAF